MMSRENGSTIDAALRQIPSGLFVLTTRHNDVRSGVLARWVQPCSLEPPLVMVAIAQGLPVEPLMRDSRAFALCQISAADALLRRMFAAPPDRDEDPFVSLPSHTAPSGSPIIERALSYLDCELVRHVDLDTAYRLYVGQVVHGELIHSDQTPAVVLGTNEFLSPNGTNGTNGTPRP